MAQQDITFSKPLRYFIIAAISYLVWTTSWSLAWETGLLVRTIYSALMVGIFLYITYQMFLFSVIAFGFLSIMFQFSNALFKISERYGSRYGVAFLVVSLFIVGFSWWYLESIAIRCKKCKYKLEDEHLLDEETVTIYRCPKCGTITRYEFKDKFGERPENIKPEDDDY